MSEQEEDPKLELATKLAGEVGKEGGEKLLDLARTALLSHAACAGSKTSEFRLALVGLVGAVGLLGFGAYLGDAEMQARGVELAKWCIVGYAGARGAAKLGAGLAVKQ